jgi:cyclophilin family peptidyl-prolyl cis-trans isomerase
MNRSSFVSLVLGSSLVFLNAFATDAKAPLNSQSKRKDTKVNAAVVSLNLKTNMGDIKIELDKEKAPKTVENFVQYANDKFFDKTVFHRVMDGFMIQGGGFTENMVQKPTRAPIENEGKNGLKNLRGTLAMARTNDPNSATAQFFINLVDNDFLNASPGNAGYAVFGKVVSGMDVVDKIAAVKTGNAGMHQNVPVKAVVIESLSVVK